MKIKYIVTFIATVITQSIFALSSKPTACPSVAAIRAVGVNHAFELPMGDGWIAENNGNYYDTPQKWRFTMLVTYYGESEAAAISRAHEQLKNFYLKEAPIEGDYNNNIWRCRYYEIVNGRIFESLDSADTPML